VLSILLIINLSSNVKGKVKLSEERIASIFRVEKSQVRNQHEQVAAD
jgi:hypothetical protein